MKKKSVFLINIFLFIVNLNCSLLAQININLQASRTTGVAPLYVFFDATASTGLVQNDYLNANFFWDFDNTGAKHNTAKGFVAAHVFETPGEYTVSVNVVDIEGNKAKKSITINVSEFSGTTYYVANGGNDEGAGTEAAPFATVDKGFSVLGPNTRVLFKKGDAFSMTNHSVYNLTGPVVIGSYGTGDKPVFNTSGDNWGTIYFNDGTDDVRFMDIKIVGSTSDRNQAVAQRALLTGDQASNILFLRCEVENVARDASQLYGENNAIFYCYFHDFSSYSCYSIGNNLAFVGNISRRQTGSEHFYRTQGGTNQFIAYNDFDEITSAKSSIQVRGNGTNKVVVLGNKVRGSMGFKPQNNIQEEYVSNCLAEDNISDDGLSIVATNIVVRNNILGGYINLNNHPLVGMSDNIHIYNNTIYGDLTIMINGSASNVKLKNNCYYTTSTHGYAAAISLPSMADANQIEVDNNVYYAPNKSGGSEPWFHLADVSYYTFSDWQTTGKDANSLVGDPQFVANDFYDDNYLRPASGSPLLEIGTEVPVFSDIEGNIREYGYPIHVGAYQSTVLGIDTKDKWEFSMSRLSSYPNPFSRATTISFDVSEQNRYTLKIYDYSGRQVTRLIDKTLAKGKYSIEWNGTNDKGARLNSGFYVVLLQCKNKVIGSGKIILQ